MRKKKFKKIYVEITNRCNLKCSFCGKNKRVFKDMSLLEFEMVLSKIKDYTDYIYLHVKGEPLLHKNLDEILSICDNNEIIVNITTNGVFIKEKLSILRSHDSIRQIKVSLHCENDKNNYFEDIFSCCKELSSKIFISYRIWNLDENKLSSKSTKIVEKIIDFYKLSSDIAYKLYCDTQVKIDKNTFVNKENLFVWPDLDNGYCYEGYCYGLTSHIGILSDGTVVPCCLDGNGEIALGNIFNSTMDEIISSDKFSSLKKGFNDNKSLHKLCRNCNFRNRFTK